MAPPILMTVWLPGEISNIRNNQFYKLPLLMQYSIQFTHVSTLKESVAESLLNCIIENINQKLPRSLQGHFENSTGFCFVGVFSKKMGQSKPSAG